MSLGRSVNINHRCSKWSLLKKNYICLISNYASYHKQMYWNKLCWLSVCKYMSGVKWRKCEQSIGRTTVCYFWSRLQLQSLQTVTRAQWWPPTIFFIIFLFGENWNFGCPHETEARRPTACHGSPCNQKGVQYRHWVSCDAKLNTKPRTKIGIALSLGLSGCLVPLTLVFMSVLQCDTKCFSIGKSFIWKRHYKLWTPKTNKSGLPWTL